MRKMKKIALYLLLLLLTVSVSSRHVAADLYDTYQVTVYAGEHGSLNYGEESGLEMKQLQINAHERFNPNDFEVVVDDDKYYFKGFLLSGTEGKITGDFKVEEDTTLVACYGIKSQQVPYVIRYVLKGTDTELLPSETRHGNVKDETIVAYRYIAGYLPDFYNARLVLSEDGSKNVVVFEYTKVDASVIYEEGEAIADGTGTRPGGNPSPSGNGTQDNSGTQEDTEPFIPEDIVDIVDPDAPTTDTQPGDDVPPVEQEDNETNAWLITLLLALGISLFVILLILMLLRRKRKQEEE